MVSPSVQTVSSMASPAETCQTSSASIRCQCDRSPAASRYTIALAAGRTSAVPASRAAVARPPRLAIPAALRVCLHPERHDDIAASMPVVWPPRPATRAARAAPRPRFDRSIDPGCNEAARRARSLVEPRSGTGGVRSTAHERSIPAQADRDPRVHPRHGCADAGAPSPDGDVRGGRVRPCCSRSEDDRLRCSRR